MYCFTALSSAHLPATPLWGKEELFTSSFVSPRSPSRRLLAFPRYAAAVAQDAPPTQSSSSTGKRRGAGGSQFIYGVYPVLFALRCRRRQIKTLWVQEKQMDKNGLPVKSAKKPGIKDQYAQEEIQDLAWQPERSIVIEPVPRSRLDDLSGGAAHQGFVLECEPWEPAALAKLPKAQPGELWLVLSGNVDDATTGNLIRSAAFFAASGVICDATSAASLTSFASKASAGAVESLQIHKAASLPELLQEARERSWCIIGAGTPAGEEEKGEIWSCSDGSLPIASGGESAAAVLVFGPAWGDLAPEVASCCSAFLAIDGAATKPEQVKLNLDVAGGIALQAVRDALGDSASAEC